MNHFLLSMNHTAKNQTIVLICVFAASFVLYLILWGCIFWKPARSGAEIRGELEGNQYGAVDVEDQVVEDEDETVQFMGPRGAVGERVQIV